MWFRSWSWWSALVHTNHHTRSTKDRKQFWHAGFRQKRNNLSLTALRAAVLHWNLQLSLLLSTFLCQIYNMLTKCYVTYTTSCWLATVHVFELVITQLPDFFIQIPRCRDQSVLSQGVVRLHERETFMSSSRSNAWVVMKVIVKVVVDIHAIPGWSILSWNRWQRFRPIFLEISCSVVR